MEGIDPAIKPADFPHAVKKFVTAEMLGAKQVERKSYIEDILRKTYTEDEIQSLPFQSFSTDDAVVWIDPLDGTSDFVKGNLPAVTVLIGLAIKGYSRAGIVHNPFSEED